MNRASECRAEEAVCKVLTPMYQLANKTPAEERLLYLLAVEMGQSFIGVMSEISIQGFDKPCGANHALLANLATLTLLSFSNFV